MMSNTLDKPFRVVEGNLHDMDHTDPVTSFDFRWEAEEYVDENDERSNRAGCCLFIEGPDG